MKALSDKPIHITNKREQIPHQAPPNKVFDFTNKDPNAILTRDEIKHFDEGMQLINDSCPAEFINFDRASESVIRDLPKLLP
jgi:hypothetical protein